MNRSDLQQLAEERIRDAAALLNSGQWSGAYYLAGYAVECALKACIAKLTQAYDFPDKERAKDSYTHDLEKLVKAAGIDVDRQVSASSNPAFGTSWQIVKDWDEGARYAAWTETQARTFFESISNPTDGVIAWIKLHW